MEGTIELLHLEDFPKCRTIWDLEERPDLAEMCREGLRSGVRRTWVWRDAEAYRGEVSLALDGSDSDYIVPERRICLSRLIVAEGWRRRGIGTALIRHAVRDAESMGYRELSVGVDLVNWDALRLYVREGFDQILRTDEDEVGQYLVLLRRARLGGRIRV